MSDVSITAANVVAADGAQIEVGTAGGTITAGQIIYVDSSGLYQVADCLDSTKDAVAGVALQNVAVSQRLAIASKGTVGVGAVLSPGMPYILSEAGAIAPASDLASADYSSLVGVASSWSNLMLGIINTGTLVS